jgi:hypothetical protein
MLPYISLLVPITCPGAQLLQIMALINRPDVGYDVCKALIHTFTAIVGNCK